MPVPAQWKPEVNALTTPKSWRPRHVPHTVLGDRELAAEVAQANPNYNQEAVETILAALIERIQVNLISGNQITLKNALTFRLALSGRLNSPDDPLPPLEDCLNVQVTIARPFLDEIRQTVQFERLPMSKKLPLITAAADTVLKLNDVLNPNGALHLTGSDMFFEEEHAGGECVLEGTQSGRQAQSRFTLIANTGITLLPDIPAQDELWNNEYLLSISTHYTENGSLRTGIYERRLRTPLRIQGLSFETGPGILTDNAATPYVRVQTCVTSTPLLVRIEAALDLHTDELFLRLLDMTERGLAGERVKVTTTAVYTLPGFSDSPLSSMEVVVDNPTGLAQMVRTHYAGRVVDVLDIRIGS